MKVWFCEDLETAEQSAFGKTRREAECRVRDNRGYGTFAACVKEGWCKPAVEIDLPKAIAEFVLEASFRLFE